MKCSILGSETMNKWKGIPTSVEALEAARKIQELKPYLTMRQALKMLQGDVRAFVKEEMIKREQDETA